MNILLTGGAGYIGSHIAILLLSAGHRVLIVDNFCNCHASAISAIETISGKKITSIKADIRNTSTLIQLLRSEEIEAVIHLAGLKAVGESTIHPLEYYANNVQGAISLLQAMQESRVSKLVFSSSATVYGDPQYLPLDENHPTVPTNPYGQTKLIVEQILQDISSADKDFRVVNLRYFNPVGAHESGLIGENPKGIPNNLMPLVSEVAAGKKKSLSVYGGDYSTADGTGVRDYIHVMDLAEGHMAALDFLNDNQGMSTFNLGTGSGHSVLEVVRAFESKSGKKILYQIAPRRVGDIASCYADVKKANLNLKWSSKYALDDMCLSAWRWQLSLE